MSNTMINCVVVLCFLHAMAHEKLFQFNIDLWRLFYLFSFGWTVREKTCQNNLLIDEIGYVVLLHRYKRPAYLKKNK